jgi:hypothetical protein
VEALFEMLWNCCLSDMRAKKGTEQTPTVHILTSTVGVCQNSLLKVVSVLASEVHQ